MKRSEEQMLLDKELVRSDLNLEKWEIFSTRKSRGERILTRTAPGRTQQVKIGITVRNGRSHTLTASDGKIFYILLKRWEQAGRPVTEPVRFSIRSLCKELGIAGSAQGIRQIKDHLLNLFEVPIKFIESYKTPKHTDTITTALHLLSSLKIFERKKRPDGTIEKYFGFSEFKIHETIMDTILKRGMKPIRLDVVRTLRSDCAFILYRYFDLMLFASPWHQRDLLEIAEICDLQRDQPLYDIKRTIQHALDELVGKEIATGRIARAEICPSETASGWKVFVSKGAQLSAEKEAIDYEAHFLGLPVLEQEEIRKQAEENAKDDLFFGRMSAETKEEWIKSEILSIVKENLSARAQAGMTNPANRAVGPSAHEGRKIRKEPRQEAKPLPSKPLKAEVKIIYRNDRAGSVQIAGEWGNWKPEAMEKSGADLWEKSLELLPGDYKYKLVVDGVWQRDPHAENAGDADGNNLLKVSGV